MGDDFQFVYIIQERPSVIFGGWERAGIQKKERNVLENIGDRKKSNRRL